MRVVGEVDSRGNPRVQTVNNDPSETIQSDAHLADIHQILKTWELDGHAILDEAQLEFKDVSEFTDLADAMNQAKEAEGVFMTLPSKIRELFHHDVAEFLDTAHDPEKRNAMVEAGVLEGVEVVETRSGGGAAGAATGETAESAGDTTDGAAE